MFSYQGYSEILKEASFREGLRGVARKGINWARKLQGKGPHPSLRLSSNQALALKAQRQALARKALGKGRASPIQRKLATPSSDANLRQEIVRRIRG